MKRKLFHIANLSLTFGAALVIYVVYASLQHTMSWTKLVLFWLGCAGVAVFLLYHLLARMPKTWQSRPIRRYSLLHRAACAAILLIGLFAATGFSYYTWQTWQLPALYGEPIAVNKIARDRFDIILEIGNQRYHRGLHVQEIQLIALNDRSPERSTQRVALYSDSLLLPIQINPALPYGLILTNELRLSPLEKQRLRLDLQTSSGLVIYQIRALYRENGKTTRDTLSFEPYVLLEPQQLTLIDFAGLAARSRQPSYETQHLFIQAIARSQNPTAINILLELLQVHDVRLQNAVCDALAILGDTRAAPALIELFQQSKNPHALRALGELRTGVSVNFLIRTLQDHPEAYLRAEAAEALGRIAVPPRGEFARAIPALAEVLTHSAAEDAMVQREAMLALARINDTLAIPVILQYAAPHHSGQALRNLLDVTTILGDKWLLPVLGQWLVDWRYYNLDLDDVQLLLDYLVATSHRDMVQVLIEALQTEISAEAQTKFTQALSQITGTDLGQIQYPVLNLATDNANRRVITKWQKWWKRAQQDSLFREQIKPIG